MISHTSNARHRSVPDRTSQVPIESRYTSDRPRLPLPSLSDGLPGSPSFSNLDFYPGQLPAGLEPDAPYSYVGEGMVAVHMPDKRKSMSMGVRSRAKSVGEKHRICGAPEAIVPSGITEEEERDRRRSRRISTRSIARNPIDIPDSVTRQTRRRSRTLSGLRPVSREDLSSAFLPGKLISAPALPDSSQDIRSMRNNALATLTGTSKVESLAQPKAGEPSNPRVVSLASTRATSHGAVPAHRVGIDLTPGTCKNPPSFARVSYKAPLQSYVGRGTVPEIHAERAPKLDISLVSSFDINAMLKSRRQSRTVGKSDAPTVVITKPSHTTHTKENASPAPEPGRLRTQTETSTVPRISRDLRHSRSLEAMLAMSTGGNDRAGGDQVPLPAPLTLAEVNARLRKEKEAKLEELLRLDSPADTDKTGAQLSRSFSRLGPSKKQILSPTSPVRTQPHYKKIARSDTSPQLQKMLESAGLVKREASGSGREDRGTIKEDENWETSGTGSDKQGVPREVAHTSLGEATKLRSPKPGKERDAGPRGSSSPDKQVPITMLPKLSLPTPDFPEPSSSFWQSSQAAQGADEDAAQAEEMVKRFDARGAQANAVRPIASADSGSRYSLNDGTMEHSLGSSTMNSSRLLGSTAASGITSGSPLSQTAVQSAGKLSFETVDRKLTLSPQIKKVAVMPWEEEPKMLGLDSPRSQVGGVQRSEFAISRAGSIKSVRTLRRKLSNKLLSIFSPGNSAIAPISPGISHASYCSTPPPSPALPPDQSRGLGDGPQFEAASKATATDKTAQVLAWRTNVHAYSAAAKLDNMINNHKTAERSRMAEKYGVALDAETWAEDEVVANASGSDVE